VSIDLARLPLPRCIDARQVVAPGGAGPGHWAGAPSAIRVGGATYLAYRMRRPVEEGRGGSNVVAVSADGVTFTTVWSTERAAFEADSLERPCLTRGPDGVWRLYVSCATPGTRHWRVEVLEAPDPSAFDVATRRTVFPGDTSVAMKDPVIHWWKNRWHAWVCCHPLDDPDATDRMWTEHATSDDGVHWNSHSRALVPVPGRWDSRGVRISDVLFVDEQVIALYDGRATAGENFEERMGVAVGDGERPFAIVGTDPAAQSPDGGHGLRYVSVVPEDLGRYAVYYEAALADGSHDLRVERVAAGVESVAGP